MLDFSHLPLPHYFLTYYYLFWTNSWTAASLINFLQALETSQGLKEKCLSKMIKNSKGYFPHTQGTYLQTAVQLECCLSTAGYKASMPWAAWTKRSQSGLRLQDCTSDGSALLPCWLTELPELQQDKGGGHLNYAFLGESRIIKNGVRETEPWVCYTGGGTCNLSLSTLIVVFSYQKKKKDLNVSILLNNDRLMHLVFSP